MVGVAHAPVDVGASGVLCEQGPCRPRSWRRRSPTCESRCARGTAGERGRVDPDVRLPELLLARSPRLARRLAERVFEPLVAAGRPDLVQTLELLAEHGFERGATAAALPVHRNTLLQRIARIEELTGLDLDDPRDRGLVWLPPLRARCADRPALDQQAAALCALRSSGLAHPVQRAHSSCCWCGRRAIVSATPAA